MLNYSTIEEAWNMNGSSCGKHRDFVHPSCRDWTGVEQQPQNENKGTKRLVESFTDSPSIHVSHVTDPAFESAVAGIHNKVDSAIQMSIMGILVFVVLDKAIRN
jgi:hypothetical protein